MASNYELWESQQDGRRFGLRGGYIVKARGAGKKWRNRFGVTVEVLPAEAEGIDADGLPWVAVCTDHGSILAVPTKASGTLACRDTTQFCDQCREAQTPKAAP